MRAAGNHLSRVGLLADTEWKVSIAFWAAILASGTGLIGAVAGDDLQLANSFYRFSAVVLGGYFLSVYLFVFGFSRNQAQSIKTERSRFLYYQSRAIAIIEDDMKAITISNMAGTPNTASWHEVEKSPVWANKLLNSTAMTISIWIIAVIISSARTTSWNADLDLFAFLNYVIAVAISLFWFSLVKWYFSGAFATRRG